MELKYRGFVGNYEVDDETGRCYGKCNATNVIITFQSETEEEIEKEFQVSIQDYQQWMISELTQICWCSGEYDGENEVVPDELKRSRLMWLAQSGWPLTEEEYALVGDFELKSASDRFDEWLAEKEEEEFRAAIQSQIARTLEVFDLDEAIAIAAADYIEQNPECIDDPSFIEPFTEEMDREMEELLEGVEVDLDDIEIVPVLVTDESTDEDL